MNKSVLEKENPGRTQAGDAATDFLLIRYRLGTTPHSQAGLGSSADFPLSLDCVIASQATHWASQIVVGSAVVVLRWWLARCNLGLDGKVISFPAF